MYWISEYASECEYARVLNIPGFCICLNMPEQFLDISDFALIYLNITKNAKICTNMP